MHCHISASGSYNQQNYQRLRSNGNAQNKFCFPILPLNCQLYGFYFIHFALSPFSLFGNSDLVVPSNGRIDWNGNIPGSSAVVANHASPTRILLFLRRYVPLFWYVFLSSSMFSTCHPHCFLALQLIKPCTPVHCTNIYTKFTTSTLRLSGLQQNTLTLLKSLSLVPGLSQGLSCTATS